MLFNSYEFVLGFLPITVLGFFWLAHRRSSGRGQPSAMLWLVATSIFFYAWWSPKYTALLIASIGANYACGLAIARARDRAYAKKLVTGAIVGNLCLLSYYKYANFFISTIAAVSGTSFGALDILLPIGISFFTFTQIAFLVDVYCKKAQEYDFIQYMLFVTYFPHLIAGPILHHKEMMPQFGAPETYRFRRSNFAIGITIFIIGLAKKVFLADGFAGWASPIFDSVDAGFRPGFAVAWIGALAYTFQLYFDFSGYSDMAIGLSRIFGIKLPLNFNSPYKATNIADFWRRWHMTLSRFLRDYLYIPLGGNRAGAARRNVNLTVTMLLGGLWHGASWTFVAWGGLHGLYLVAYHAWVKVRPSPRCVPGHWAAPGRIAGWTITFLAVVVAWVVFRSAHMSGALRMLEGMAGLNGVILPAWPVSMIPPLAHALEAIGVKLASADALALDSRHALGYPAEFVTLLLLTILTLPAPNVQELLRRYEPALDVATGPRPGIALGRITGILTGLLFALCLMSLNKRTEFLYFQF